MFEKILFPIDFSEQSIMMVDCVVELKNFGAEEVLFLHVLPKGAVLTGEQGKVVKEIMQKVESNGLKARFEKIEGDPVTAIAETAEKEEATAVVMASSGKGR
ncbi:MAG: universal stress protein, partial [Euryarchaeota archaeon]|nr:universal stress protein [Euryarchaeota archaeon]